MKSSSKRVSTVIGDFFCPNEPMHRVEKSKVMLNLIIPVVNLGFGNDSKGRFDFVFMP